MAAYWIKNPEYEKKIVFLLSDNKPSLEGEEMMHQIDCLLVRCWFDAKRNKVKLKI